MNLLAAASCALALLGCHGGEGADAGPATVRSSPAADPELERLNAILEAQHAEAEAKAQEPPHTAPERVHGHIVPRRNVRGSRTRIGSLLGSGTPSAGQQVNEGLTLPLGDIDDVLPADKLASIHTGVVPHAYASVMLFGAHGDGATDDSPAFQAAVDALSGTGVALYIPPLTYLLNEQVNLHAGLVIVGAPGTVIHQDLAAKTNYSAFSGAPTIGAPTSVVAANAVGSNQVEAATSLDEGSWILLQDAAGLRGNVYQVLSSVAVGGGYLLTLDRPVQWQFSASDFIYPVLEMMQDVYVFGEGMVISGPAHAPFPAESGYIGFGASYHCFVYDVQVDGRFGLYNVDFGTGINFDIGSHDCAAYRTTVDCHDQLADDDVALAAFAAQSGENVTFEGDTSVNCNQGFWVGSGYGNTIENGSATASHEAGVKLTTTELAPPTGSTYTNVDGGTFTDNPNGILIDEGSSYNTFTSCSVLESTNNGFNVQSNGGGTVGNRLVDVTVSKTGAAGAAAIVVSGNAHQLSIQNLTTMQNQLAAVYVNGAASSIDVDGWTSVDDGLTGGALTGQGLVAGTSTLSVKDAHLSSSKPIRGMPVYFEALSSGSTLLLDGVILTQIGGAGAANQVAVDNSDAAGAVVRMRNVTTVGPLLGGVWAAGAPSLTYVLEDVDLSSATYPYNIAPGALANFGTFTANGSTEVATNGAFSARATISISLASAGTIPCEGIPTFSSPTRDGTFYTTSSTPGCNSTYNWRASE